MSTEKDSVKKVSEDFHKEMQKVVNKSEGFNKISVSTDGGQTYQTIAEKKPAPEKDTYRVMKESTRLECQLTDPEKLSYSQDLTEHITDKSRAEDNLKSFKSQMKSEIDGHIAAINLLSGKISSGREYRLVDIEIHFDYNTRLKTYIRTDTGQVFKHEAIQQHELQLHLDLEEKRLIEEDKINKARKPKPEQPSAGLPQMFIDED